MVIITSKADSIIKRTIGNGKSLILSPDKMIDQFKLDPTIMNPPHDIYIITNEDISNKRMKDKFEQCVKTKHKAVKVMLINKSNKPIYENGFPGINAILQQPSPDDVTKTITRVVETTQISDMIQNNINTKDVIPEYSYSEKKLKSDAARDDIGEAEEIGYDDVEKINAARARRTAGAVGDVDEVEDAESVEEVPIPDIEDAEAIGEAEPIEEPEERPSTVIDSFKTASSIADISVVMREVTAESIIKDLYQTSSTYAGIEDKLKSINEVIYNILNDETEKSLTIKLNKIHAVLHDKAFYRAKGDTLIEQRLEEVIDTICDRVSDLVNTKVGELDKAIKTVYDNSGVGIDNTRLASIADSYNSINLELMKLHADTENVMEQCDKLLTDMATTVGEKEASQTQSTIINEQLEARGQMIVTDESLSLIRKAMDMSADKVPTTFYKLLQNVDSELRLYRKLTDCDHEALIAQQNLINMLKAQNIEETVVARTAIKQSLRLFVAPEGTGRTIIPYLMSRYKSRQNSNVLLVDITGTVKYDQYNIAHDTIDNNKIEFPCKEFEVISGTIDNSIATAQIFMTALLKAADYYRIINIVLTPEQADIIATLVPDTLSVNYIVNTDNKSIAEVRDMISNMNTENVAKRIIINKCDIPVSEVIKTLGLEDSIDYQLCQIHNIREIAESALKHYDPYGVSAVDLEMEEALRHA